MKATELYALGCRAYDGEQEARREWLAKVARLAIPYAVKYGVLPGLVAAKAALESGYASDKYEVDFYETQFRVKIGRKAQKHNNIIGMNAFPDNQKFMEPAPAWCGYKSVFYDYGPHFHADRIELTPNEPWMHFKSVEDCVEAWCANIRWQAEKNLKPWGSTIERQLLAIESYTPEGAKAETPGMHYEWQDYILYLYKDYDLYAIDREAYKMAVAMTVANLDKYIKSSYEYAHKDCVYGPTDRSFPPMANGYADCVGLALQALYLMGYNHAAHNIDEIMTLCANAGMKKSTDIHDVWRRHCIVCMQDKNNRGTQHVNHVYYSLGGTSINDISKYDLGSNDRIRAAQPFTHVAVNEWPDKRDFFCVWYVETKETKKREDVPSFTVKYESSGITIQKAWMYAGPGVAWRKIKTVEDGTRVMMLGLVTNDSGHLWRVVRVGTREGYMPAKAVVQDAFETYKGIVTGTDGQLAVRVGAGATAMKVADVPEKAVVTVLNVATAKDGSKWLQIRYEKIRGYVSGMYVKAKR